MQDLMIVRNKEHTIPFGHAGASPSLEHQVALLDNDNLLVLREKAKKVVDALTYEPLPHLTEADQARKAKVLEEVESILKILQHLYAQRRLNHCHAELTAIRRSIQAGPTPQPSPKKRSWWRRVLRVS